MKYCSFCAANSGDGFISFFDTLLDEKRNQVYYIKGGPGSGKSTLMKQIAAQANDAELIYCSGDPDSLDGVVLPKKKAIVIDATSPHSHEPTYPGVGGNIIDLGEGWTPQKMNKNRIIALCDEKRELYQCCYNLLNGAKKIHEGIFKPLTARISETKLHVAANKILRQNALWEKRDAIPHISKRFLSGISPDGRITFTDTFKQLGKNFIVIEDRWMIAHPLLNILEQKLTDNGIDHINGYHPLIGKQTLQHLIIPEANLSILSRDGVFPLNIPEEQIIKKINMQSMLEKEYLDRNKNKLAFIKRLERELLNLATEKLEEARTVHMKIEQEYAKGTNFDATSGLKEKLINNLFGST